MKIRDWSIFINKDIGRVLNAVLFFDFFCNKYGFHPSNPCNKAIADLQIYHGSPFILWTYEGTHDILKKDILQGGEHTDGL